MAVAVISGGVVINCIVAEPDFTISGFVLVEMPEGAGIGWIYDGENFAPPSVLLSSLKQNKTEAVDAKRELVLSGGFTVPIEVSATLGDRVLQTRNQDDKTAWLTSQAAYQAAVLNGQGAFEGANFRPMDNITTTISYSEGLSVLLAMAAWGKAVYGRSWELKDAITSAEDNQALDAIDIESGWPE